MTAAVEIRPYAPADRDAVVALVAAVLTEHGFSHAVGGVARDLDEIGSRYGAAGAGFWVAVEGGEVVGTVAIRPKEGDACELKRLYLRADRRGTGLGQRLYAHAEDFARASGYGVLWLDSSRRFEAAHRLYLRNGFSRVASLDNDWQDDIFEKRLAPPGR